VISEDQPPKASGPVPKITQVGLSYSEIGRALKISKAAVGTITLKSRPRSA
jgi:hypothetical protein